MKLKNVFLVSLMIVFSGLIISNVYAKPQTVTLVKVKGIVEIIPQGMKEGSVGVAGMKLKEGDTVKTYDKSQAEIAFGDTGTLYVKSESSLTINQADVKGEETKTVTTLQNGKLKPKVKKLSKNSRFETRTPVAVAAVRGTIYEMYVGDDGEAIIRVLEGSIRLTNKFGYVVTIEPGQFVKVDANGKMDEPEADTKMDVKDLEKVEEKELKEEVDSRNLQVEEIEASPSGSTS